RTLEQAFDVGEPGAVVTVASMKDQLAVALRPARIGMWVLVGLGTLAVVLAMIGLHGVISYTVNRRTFEIGIRIAVGATRAAVMRIVVVDALIVVGAGALLGSALSFLVITAMRPLLVAEQHAGNPLVAVFALLLFVGVGVSLWPAHRAASM